MCLKDSSSLHRPSKSSITGLNHPSINLFFDDLSPTNWGPAFLPNLRSLSIENGGDRRPLVRNASLIHGLESRIRVALPGQLGTTSHPLENVILDIRGHVYDLAQMRR